MDHNHQGSNRERVEIETLKDLNFTIWLGKLTQVQFETEFNSRPRLYLRKYGYYQYSCRMLDIKGTIRVPINTLTKMYTFTVQLVVYVDVFVDIRSISPQTL